MIGLLAWGLVMVYSASIAMSDNPRFGKILPYHFVLRHAIALGVGFVACPAGLSGAHGGWQQLAPRIFLLALVLLVLVLVPGVGLGASMARGAGCRWG